MTLSQPGHFHALAASTGRPAAFYVREAVAEHLGELEYVYTLRAEAEAARRGDLPTTSLDDLAAELGFDADDLRAEARANVALDLGHRSDIYD